ncbi:MAG: glycosyltransferase [Elusimicrobiota bacterium]|nr:MAG: glycosyltransferase [Elusimicrobiota bacterium]
MGIARPECSVVIPVYNSQGSAARVAEDVLAAFAGVSLQLVLVDDGSRDESARVCRELAGRHPGKVLFARLSRNFGEHNAVLAGLRLAAGRFVVVMDDDGENRPEDARRLFERARETDADLVYSRYPGRHHAWWRLAGSRFNGWVAGLLIRKPKDLYLSSFKCLSGWLVSQVTRYEGPFPYLDGLALQYAGRIEVVDCAHAPSERAASNYNLRRLGRLWLNMAVNFSVAPLRLSSLLGAGMVALGGVLTAEVVVERFTSPSPTPPGWAHLAVLVLVFSGAQLLILGVIGEYLGRLFLMANRLPQSAVRELVGAQRPEDADVGS